MELDQILRNIIIQKPDKSFKVSRPCSDHRQIKAGDTFIAIKGTSFDGHNVISDVLEKKPNCVVVSDPKFYNSKNTILVSNSRLAMDMLSHEFLGRPSEKLFCVGVTGTNGKTTITHLVEHALNKTGCLTGVIGTINHHVGKKIWHTDLTTPGSFEIYQRLNDFILHEANALSIEVSSHALDQDRLTSCQFDVAIFSNLTRDHLDYHLDMESYFQAKNKFFNTVIFNSKKSHKAMIINSDDEYSSRIEASLNVEKITYGQKNADLKFTVVKEDFSGQTVSFTYKNQKATLNLKVSGLFNAYNVAAALAVILFKGMKLIEAAKLFEDFLGVDGRLQRVSTQKALHVFIDYAHTPDALENVLKTLQNLKQKNKIITVFGCGGNRDKMKRPIMGEVACRLSDHVVLTSDNPRMENPFSIIEDIKKGCHNFSNYVIEEDRRLAIKKAIEMAKTGDAVLIAGKGHEDYQIIGEKKLPFSDYNEAKKVLE